MAQRLSVSSSPPPIAAVASSRLLSPPTATRVSLSNFSTALSLSSTSSLKCLGSSPLVSHLFLHQRSAVRVSGGNFSTATSPKCFASDPAQLKSAREDIKELLKTTFCHPIMGQTIESCMFEGMRVVNTRWGITTIARRGWREIRAAIDRRTSQFIYLTTSNRFHKSVLALGCVCTEIL